jgi:hypothetical protein
MRPRVNMARVSMRKCEKRQQRCGMKQEHDLTSIEPMTIHQRAMVRTRCAVSLRAALAAVSILAIAGCTSAYDHSRLPQAPQLPQRSNALVAPVLAYPAQGQSAEQQSRDRFECYEWAVKQTGFDPSAPRPNQSAAVERHFVRYGPSSDVALANATMQGAVLGAIVSRDPGRGAVVGALAALVLGAIVEERSEVRQRDAEDNRRAAVTESRAELAAPDADYVRALSACLTGRGYQVK